jgi:hypothetical protein
VRAGIIVSAVTAARVNKDVALSMRALNRKGSVRKEVRTFRCALAFCGFPSPELIAVLYLRGFVEITPG